MTEQDTPRRWRGRLADAALLVFVMALGAKAAAGAAAVHDVDGADECAYTLSAFAVPERGLPAVEGSPLYILWGWGILKAGVPPEDMSVTSWSLLAVLLPGAVFLLVRALGGGRPAALVAGGGLLATTLIDVWPYPMHLATLVLVSGTAAAARLRPPASGAALGLTLLAATYARPEFLYAMYVYAPLAATGAVWLAWRRPGARAGLLVSLFGLACGGGVLVWALGSPKGEGNRSMAAFGQHYALNRYEAGERPENPWLHWETYIHEDFGPVTSVGEALRTNRAAFLWHIETNARHIPRAALAAVAPRVDLLLLRCHHISPPTPLRHPRTEAKARWAMLGALAVGLLGAGLALRKLVLGRDGNGAGRLAVGVAMLALVAAPALAATLTIYPRFHYLIPTIVFVGAIAAAGFRHLPVPARLTGTVPTVAATLTAAVVLALVVPNRAHGWCVQQRLGRATNQQSMLPVQIPLRATVRTVRELGLRPPVVFLNLGAGLPFYAGFGDGFVTPANALPGERFLDFVKRVNVGVVFLEPFLTAYPQVRDDPDMRALVDGKESAVFAVFPVKEYPALRIAVRRDLLPAPKTE